MIFVRLKNLREDHDLSQNDIADYLNISQRTYSYYETGGRDIPIQILIKLADYYKTSIDYLVNRREYSKRCVNSKKRVRM